MQTETQLKDLQFIVVPDRKPPPLPPVPVAVAVARIICHPVEAAEVVPVPHPERLCWAQFEPMRRPDPFLPVPLAEFGPELWERLRAWGKHYLRFIPRGDVAPWAARALDIMGNLAAFLASRYATVGLTRGEAYWLTGTLWQSYAQPVGAPELVRADTRLNQQRRRVQRQARVKARRRQEDERIAREYGCQDIW